MAEANQAYEDANEERLRAILQGWETSSSVKGEVVTELIGTIRQNCPKPEAQRQFGKKLRLWNKQTLPAKTKVITAQQAGQDLLAEMASQLDEQILPQKNG